ncbi:MAG: tetratricopeptide repeat protein [Bacteroidetes Order II. Incertae sedis bacterium]|nr:tetratricopeptide repeat protein [Bacteroidetes Order II. bacterium]
MLTRLQIKTLFWFFWIMTPVQMTVAQGNIEKYQLADSYLRSNQTDKAIPLLEDVLAANPREYAFYDRLREAYATTKRYEDALRIIDQRLGWDPSPNIMADKAAVLFKQGKELLAMDTWEQAIERAPNDQNTYRMVFYSLYRERLFDQATAFLEKARTKFNDAKLFNMEMAYGYGFAGKFDKAISEYLILVLENPAMISFVKAQLAQMNEQQGALAAFTTAVDRAVRQTPLNKTYRELAAWLYLEASDYQKALQANVALDRLENMNGANIYSFAQTAADAGYFDVAEEAYKLIISQYAASPMAPNAQLSLATMLRKRAETLLEKTLSPAGLPTSAPNYEAAKQAYQQFADAYPTHPLTPQMLYELAELYQNVFFDLTNAEATHRRIEKQFFGTEYYWKSQYELGQLAVLQNNLEQANTYYNKVHVSLRTGELAEKAQFQKALMAFYQGHFEMAKSITEVINQNTTTDVTNDAIELKVIIRENTEQDTVLVPMNLFAKARLFERQRKFGDALDKLDSLITHFKDHTLIDEARFSRAGVLRALGRFPEAIEAYKAVQKDYPKSYLADRALFDIAEILAQNDPDKRKAIDQYAEVLIKYPGSLLAPEVRSRIRKLRGDKISS